MQVVAVQSIAAFFGLGYGQYLIYRAIFSIIVPSHTLLL